MPGRSKTMRRSRSRSHSRSHSRSMKGGEGEERAVAADPVASQDSGAAAPTPVAQAGGRRRSHSRTAKRSRSHSRSHSRSRRGGFGGLVAMAKEALVPFGLFYLQKRTQRRRKN